KNRPSAGFFGLVGAAVMRHGGSLGVITVKVRKAIGEVDIDLVLIRFVDDDKAASAVLLSCGNARLEIAVGNELRSVLMIPIDFNIDGPGDGISGHVQLLIGLFQ
ncbi:TPA: hypothetical protein ACRNRC_005568, partial [Pseudomonas aeruginosa]